MVSDIKIGITGLPGSGKTYALLRVIDMLREEGIVVGGMINEPVDEAREASAEEPSEEVKEKVPGPRVSVKGKRKVGFTVRDLMTGECVQFASTDIAR